MSTLTTRTIVPTGTWVVDQAHSKAGFAVNHMGIATVCGEFTEFQGTLPIAGELSSAKAYGTVKAASVDTDEPQRDAHLRSPDFFDAETYPELAFESTAIEIIDEETLRISANLTLHGVTNDDRPHRRGQPHRHRPVRQREGRQRWHMGRRGADGRRSGPDRAGDGDEHMTVRGTTRAALFPGRQAGSLLTRQGPLAGRYPAVAAMVIFALVPYLILSAALQPLAPIIASGPAHEPAGGEPD